MSGETAKSCPCLHLVTTPVGNDFEYSKFAIGPAKVFGSSAEEGTCEFVRPFGCGCGQELMESGRWIEMDGCSFKIQSKVQMKRNPFLSGFVH